MKITLTFLLAICISIFSSSCNKINSIVEEIANPTLKNLEKSIRKKQDPRAKLSYEQYEKLLTVLDNTKFIVLPIK